METPNTQKKKRTLPPGMGGRQPGAGRPKGTRNALTVEREKVLEDWKNGVARRATALLQAQTVLATGCIKVFVIRSHWEGSGKNAKRVRSKPEIVETDEEIIAALDHEYGDGESPNDDDVYYFVATKDPENGAIDSLLNRTFGKPKESVAVEHSGKITLAQLLGKGALDKGSE